MYAGEVDGHLSWPQHAHIQVRWTGMKKTYRYCLLFCCFALSLSASGSNVQDKDSLKIDRKYYSIDAAPLESYYKKTGKPRPSSFKVGCSTNWRGYLASWLLKNKTLYLTELHKPDGCRGYKKMWMFSVFPFKRKPIKASWFTGTISAYAETSEKIPGKKTRYHRKQIILEFKNGVLTAKKEFVQVRTFKIPPRGKCHIPKAAIKGKLKYHDLALVAVKSYPVGGFSYRKNKNIFKALSMFSKDMLAIDYLTCIARYINRYNNVQAEWLRSKLLFLRTGPTPAAVDRWQKQHSFPGNTGR